VSPAPDRVCTKCGQPAEDDLRPDLCGRCARALLRRAQAYESVLVADLSPDRSTLAVTVGRN
jgi:NMD protein affecting ribosome stability and mRNA decay